MRSFYAVELRGCTEFICLLKLNTDFMPWNKALLQTETLLGLFIKLYTA
jgi:hypothetical protein